jgi:hypothetical protein
MQYTEPGWLLFRNQHNGHALVMFLVGESPAFGIVEPQFEKAMRLDPQTLIGVLGPSFSGGFPSLKHGLGEHIHDTPVVTGSATSTEAADAFCTGCLRLSRTVDTDEKAVEQFGKYLDGRHVTRRGVADLEETDTAYGNETADGAKLPRGERSKPAHVRFPRDISALRGVYASNQLLQQSLDQSPKSFDSDPAVKLSGDESGDGPDSVPIQSPAATAATEDLELSRRLEDGGFSMASLRATNPLDVVFLRQYIAAHDPDLQFYLLEPDILFTHQPEVHAFRGTLAVSRYTLFESPSGHKHDKSGRQISVFPSKAAEGVYWAARSLLGGRREGQSTHLWLSMIGIDGYWPVARLAPDQDTCTGNLCPSPDAVNNQLEWPISPTRVYVTLWLFVASALLFITVAAVKGYFARQALQEHPENAPRKWFADFVFDPAAPLVFARRYHAYCLVLGLAAILLLLSRPLAEAWNAWVYLAALPALPGLWVCCPLNLRRSASVPLYQLSGEETTHFDRKSTPFLTVGVTLGVVAILVLLYAGVWERSDDDWAHFAAYRSVHLGNGVNPTMPLLLTGLSLVCCAWYHFQRFIFASERFTPLHLSGFGTLQGPYERVRDILARYATGPALIASSMAAGLVFTMKSLYESALSIEGSNYDTAVTVALAASAFFTMLSVCQFLQAWWNLSDFLQALQGLPVRVVFSRLPRELGSVALFSVSPRQRSYLYFLRARDCLRRIIGLPAYILTNVDESVAMLLKRTGADERETSAEAIAAQTSFLAANSFLLPRLQEQVWSKGESAPAELTGEKERNAAVAEEFMALRFLSFIRYATLQLRNLLTYFSVGFILQAMAVSSYPFFSRSLSKMFILITFAILSGAAGYVLWGMSRDTILRSLATDDKGRDHPIALQALQTASLPLLAFATTYFPDLGNSLLGWINTAVDLGK